MKPRDLEKLGIPRGECTALALRAFHAVHKSGRDARDARDDLAEVAARPQDYLAHEQYGELARGVQAHAAARVDYVPRPTPAPCRIWGEGLEAGALEQMENACRLPIALAGALMPDAHQGYGLPIGGVLATDGAVIPYAVGVDIACRMKLTILDRSIGELERRPTEFRDALERETRFGVGAEFKQRRQHAVMDEDWSVSSVTQRLRDKAWAQLGTSGSGNHFVEFGEFTVLDPRVGLPEGTYLGLLSHSGSRGTGGEVARHYSDRALRMHPELPPRLRHLAWLELSREAGAEYWAAMELMGAYAAANHHLIHKSIARALGASVLLDLENHHNFAWRERHRLPDGSEREVIVHRKGATPAGDGVIGIIPGSMATPGFVVRGRGEPTSFNSASHGAGRRMSRSQAKRQYTWKDVRHFLEQRKVTVISAGIDEVPMAYKDINAVMAAQSDLVEPLARFEPRLVKMCPGDDPPED